MKYYSIHRPITPGSYPKSPFKKILNIVNFDSRTYCKEIGQEAWGYIEYKTPLHPEDAAEYELMPVPDKIIHISFIGVDSWGCRVYKDETGRLWKYSDPGEIPEERHDGLFRASRVDGCIGQISYVFAKAGKLFAHLYFLEITANSKLIKRYSNIELFSKKMECLRALTEAEYKEEFFVYVDKRIRMDETR